MAAVCSRAHVRELRRGATLEHVLQLDAVPRARVGRHVGAPLRRVVGGAAQQRRQPDGAAGVRRRALRGLTGRRLDALEAEQQQRARRPLAVRQQLGGGCWLADLQVRLARV